MHQTQLSEKIPYGGFPKSGHKYTTLPPYIIVRFTRASLVQPNCSLSVVPFLNNAHSEGKSPYHNGKIFMVKGHHYFLKPHGVVSRQHGVVSSAANLRVKINTYQSKMSKRKRQLSDIRPLIFFQKRANLV